MPRGRPPATTVTHLAAASGTIISPQISLSEKVRAVLLSPGSQAKSMKRHVSGSTVGACDMPTWIGTNRSTQKIAVSISVVLLGRRTTRRSCPQPPKNRIHAELSLEVALLISVSRLHDVTSRKTCTLSYSETKTQASCNFPSTAMSIATVIVSQLINWSPKWDGSKG